MSLSSREETWETGRAGALESDAADLYLNPYLATAGKVVGVHTLPPHNSTSR